MTQQSDAGRVDRKADARASAEKIHLGWFQAKYLWPLLPFVERARGTDPERWFNGNIVLEPCAEGGAYLVALTGHATVIIRDPDAGIDEAVTLDIPDAAFHAAKAIEMPMMNYCGERYQLETPEWAQPGRVYVYSAGMHICTKMRHPTWADANDEFQPALFSVGASVGSHTVGLDYRMKEGRPKADWRHLLKKANSATLADSATVYFNPGVPALFCDLWEMLLDDSPEETTGIIISHTATAASAENSVTILRFEGHPDIVGIWAGQKRQKDGPAPIPSHFLSSEE